MGGGDGELSHVTALEYQEPFCGAFAVLGFMDGCGRGFRAVSVPRPRQTSPATPHSPVKLYTPAFLFSLCIHAKFLSGAQKGGMGENRFAYVPDTIGRSPQEQTSEFWKL